MRQLPVLLRARVMLLLAMVVAVDSSVVAAESNRPPPRKHSNLERLTLARLKAVHEDVKKLKAQRTSVTSLPVLNDYRCILHAHAEDSAHTGGTLPEMLADAKRAGVHAI